MFPFSMLMTWGIPILHARIYKVDVLYCSEPIISAAFVYLLIIKGCPVLQLPLLKLPF